MSSRLLRARQVEEKYGIPQGTLRYWRNIGVGPSYVKLEGSIYYPEDAIEEYIDRNRHTPSVRAILEERRRAL